MKKIIVSVLLLAFFVTFLEGAAFARMGRSGGFGGGSSMGSRGSRTYSPPSRPATSQNTYQKSQAQQQRPVQQPFQPQTGGFLRNVMGGLAGGFLGAMLFRSLGFGSMGGMGEGGGIGIIEILLLVGLGFVIFKMVKSRKQGTTSLDDYRQGNTNDYQPAVEMTSNRNDPMSGLADIIRLDPSFDERAFKDQVGDIFFKVQAAWMNRDMNPVGNLFGTELFGELNTDMEKMKAGGRINRLENIAMRGVEITEAWQEQGRDYITVSVTANVLDYVTDNAGNLVEGSKTDPVKFMEYWTFTRSAGMGAWQLSAIQQP